MVKKFWPYILAAIILFTGVQKGMAQVDVGIRGGINFAGIVGDEHQTESLIAYQAGLYIDVRLLDSPLSLQPEVLYIKKGAFINTHRIVLSYIQVPLLFKYTFNHRADLAPYLIIGPYVAFNIEDKKDVTDTRVGDNLNSITAGGTVGFGFAINHFNIGLRYSRAAVPYSERSQAGFHAVIALTAGIEL